MGGGQYSRPGRVASNLREVVAELVAFEVKDPRVAGVTITDAEISGDLRIARVFFIPRGEGTSPDDALIGLRSAARFLRREVGRRMRMRHTPELDFRFDPSLDYGARIDRKLKELGFDGASAPASEEE